MLTGHPTSINNSRTGCASDTVNRFKTAEADTCSLERRRPREPNAVSHTINAGAIAYSYKHSEAGEVTKIATGKSFKHSQAGKVIRSAAVESCRPP